MSGVFLNHCPYFLDLCVCVCMRVCLCVSGVYERVCSFVSVYMSKISSDPSGLDSQAFVGCLACYVAAGSNSFFHGAHRALLPAEPSLAPLP